jgi:hypothetical protein
VNALAEWERRELKPSLTAYIWRGWTLDEWVRDGVNVLWHAERPVMEFGTTTELAARAAELEANDER